MRSFMFNILFYVVSTFYVLMCAILAILPTRKPMMWGLSAYTHSMLFLMRWVAGIRVEIRGRKHVPAHGPCIIAAKHQSYGDGFVMFSQFHDLSFVTGDHLERFPLIPAILRKAGAIVVDNCGGVHARTAMSDQMQALKGTNRRVLIYPEGHLVPVGEKKPYRKGVWHLYDALECPVVPVATNLGLCWPQQEWRKNKGKVVVEFLPAIAPGEDKECFMADLETRVEAQSVALLHEARPELAA